MADKKNREEVLKDLKDFFVKLGLKHLDSVEKVSAVVESFSLEEIKHMFIVEGIELDEISAHTLGNYVKKAAVNMAAHAAVSAAMTGKGDNKVANHHGNQVAKRARGVSKATDALTRGHTGKKHGLGFLAREENLDESGYKGKFRVHISYDDPSGKGRASRKVLVHSVKDKDHAKSVVGGDYKHLKNIKAHSAREVKEGHILELSAKVLGNYLEKVKKANPKSVKVRNKRKDGMIKATNKIVAKEDHDCAKTVKDKLSYKLLLKTGKMRPVKKQVKEVANLRSPTTKNVKQKAPIKGKRTTNTDAAFKDVNPNKNVGESHIVELSKKTLKKYIDRAASETGSAMYASALHDGKGNYKAGRELHDQAQKRRKGISTAAKKLAKEQVVKEDWGKVAKAVKLILTPEMNAEFKKTKK